MESKNSKTKDKTDETNQPNTKITPNLLEKEESESDHINLKVVSSSGNEVFFKIKKFTKMSKLMRAYEKRSGQAMGTVRFTFDGTRINDNDTSETLEMEEGDVIDSMTAQTGGTKSPIIITDTDLIITMLTVEKVDLDSLDIGQDLDASDEEDDEMSDN